MGGTSPPEASKLVGRLILPDAAATAQVVSVRVEHSMLQQLTQLIVK